MRVSAQRDGIDERLHQVAWHVLGHLMEAAAVVETE
jgi:hypothetical protein